MLQPLDVKADRAKDITKVIIFISPVESESLGSLFTV